MSSKTNRNVMWAACLASAAALVLVYVFFSPKMESLPQVARVVKVAPNNSISRLDNVLPSRTLEVTPSVVVDPKDEKYHTVFNQLYQQFRGFSAGIVKQYHLDRNEQDKLVRTLAWARLSQAVHEEKIASFSTPSTDTVQITIPPYSEVGDQLRGYIRSSSRHFSRLMDPSWYGT